MDYVTVIYLFSTSLSYLMDCYYYTYFHGKVCLNYPNILLKDSPAINIINFCLNRILYYHSQCFQF